MFQAMMEGTLTKPPQYGVGGGRAVTKLWLEIACARDTRHEQVMAVAYGEKAIELPNALCVGERLRIVSNQLPAQAMERTPEGDTLLHTVWLVDYCVRADLAQTSLLVRRARFARRAAPVV